MDQGDLRQFINKKKIKQLDEFEASSILKDIMCGLKHLNDKHIVNRDLRPENIFVHNHHFKISDFGNS